MVMHIETTSLVVIFKITIYSFFVFVFHFLSGINLNFNWVLCVFVLSRMCLDLILYRWTINLQKM